MGRCCEVCGKGTGVGYNVPRKGLCKKKGGTGSKIGVRTKEHLKQI
jgi:large subunit ribosomal protein L28